MLPTKHGRQFEQGYGPSFTYVARFTDGYAVVFHADDIHDAQTKAKGLGASRGVEVDSFRPASHYEVAVFALVGPARGDLTTKVSR